MKSNRADGRSSRLSRRQFLGTVGLGTASAAGIAAAGAHPLLVRADGGTDHFGRIFPQLPPFAEPTDPVRAALIELGKPGGLLDANDPLAAGPINLITDPALSVNNPDNPTHTAGTTFMGQFMDHDMTFDIGSPLGVPTAPQSATNGRTPSFDLDSVYGGGPTISPQLYDPADHIKLHIESGGRFEDVPRTANNTAILGDPRNDEHMVISGLHAAFLRFHNRAVDNVRAQGVSAPDEVFAQARRLTTWHFQWLILHEFLPLFIGQPLVDEIRSSGRRFYTPKQNAVMPVEFQGAAYRFGHSMVRPSYRANLNGNPDGSPFFGFIFDTSADTAPGFNAADPNDLRGGARAPRRFIDWQTFFDFGDGQVKRNKMVDTHISSPLFHLPLAAIASHDAPTVLPQRTLLRHLTWSLPSGQSIARQMGAPVLSTRDLAELRHVGNVGFDEHTPLWYYVLKEAQLLAGGLHLGPVGGRIVGEVIIGLLQCDPASYLNVKPDWQPTVPTRSGQFRMVDLLTFAQVDPQSRALGL
jgi:Animal haem peroxidase